MKAKIALILGTRPEIIKLSPVIRRLRDTRAPFFVIHTGQHYSFEMDRVFFKDLALPEPKYQICGRSRATNLHAEHVGRIMDAIERILLKEMPRVVLVQGDTNTVLAGSLAAVKLPGILLGHVEAGLRSYNRDMPEEINRVVSDHVSHYLFAPTKQARAILLGEGITSRNIYVTGNTIVDALRQNLNLAEEKKSWWCRLTGDRDYFLMTLHRQENVDNKAKLASILGGVAKVAARFRTEVLLPLHPRTAARLKGFHIALPSLIHAIPPAGFLEFLNLETKAKLLLTDSGGVQEEGCILKVPCVTLRTSTERPETVQVGANRVAGFEPAEILRCAEIMLRKNRDWPNPFGDGHAAERILEALF